MQTAIRYVATAVVAELREQILLPDQGHVIKLLMSVRDIADRQLQLMYQRRSFDVEQPSALPRLPSVPATRKLLGAVLGKRRAHTGRRLFDALPFAPVERVQRQQRGQRRDRG